MKNISLFIYDLRQIYYQTRKTIGTIVMSCVKYRSTILATHVPYLILIFIYGRVRTNHPYFGQAVSLKIRIKQNTYV
jgi:hypothetical protein